jgi:serine protease Do
MRFIHSLLTCFLSCSMGLVLAGSAPAQTGDAPQRGGDKVEIKTSGKFMAAFREAVAKPSKSTVRILCDGKETALGVVVTKNGYILTKASDLTGKIAVRLPDGEEMDAKWVGYHEPNDLAMIKIAAKALTPVQWYDSKVAPVGHFVASVGLGEDPIAVGVVSVASRNIPKTQEMKEPNPGSGYLGIGLADPESGGPGAKVGEVMPGTPAAKAKIRVDDLIVAVDDTKIKDSRMLVETLGKHKAGEKVTLTVWRGDEELEITVTLAKRPATQAQIQNNMGSELSKRKSGFPTVLQHDTIIRPKDCGGPLCDLEGRVVGINISRAGRVESFAVPSEIIRPLLADLMSGKLPPPNADSKVSAGQ